MPRQHVTTDHFEVGDRVLVRGVPACVRMETATQVLVVCDQDGQEEWVPKSSPALTLERNSANQAARAAAAAAAAHGAPLDPTEELSSDGEDDECCICGNGGKRGSSSKSSTWVAPPLVFPGPDAPGTWLCCSLGASRGAARGPIGGCGRLFTTQADPLLRLLTMAMLTVVVLSVALATVPHRSG